MLCIPGLLLLCIGCSGINASKSVSPATFLLPGLLQADPPPEHPEPAVPADEPGITVAQN
jgi:hypothetical protein